jgi:hypothetical protein
MSMVSGSNPGIENPAQDVDHRVFNGQGWLSGVLRMDSLNYEKDLPVVAVTEEIGFGRVIGIRAYLMACGSTAAEAA